MFERILNFFKGLGKNETKVAGSGEKAKERLHLVLVQDRANVSADFLELMKQEIIDVIKKYIEVDEGAIDVRLTKGEDGETGAPALYANIPILNIRNDMKKIDPATGKVEPDKKEEGTEQKQEEENKDAIEVEKEEKQEENEEVKEETNQENVAEESKSDEQKNDESKQDESENNDETNSNEETNKNEVNNE